MVSANILTWLRCQAVPFFCNEQPCGRESLSLNSIRGGGACSMGAPQQPHQRCVELSIQWNDQVRSIPCGCQPWIVALFIPFLKFLPIIAWLRSPLIVIKPTVHIRCIGVYLCAGVGMFVVQLVGLQIPIPRFYSSVFAFFVLFHLGMHHRLINLCLVGLGLYGAAFDGLNSKPFSIPLRG